MTHDQLARRVARREGVSIRDARRVLDAASAEIAAALARGDAVTLAGVGTLTPPRTEGGRTRFRISADRHRERSPDAGDGTDPATPAGQAPAG